MIYFHVITETERTLSPREFTRRFKRSICPSFNYALANLSRYDNESFREIFQGKLKKSKLPVVLYLKETEEFRISKKGKGSYYMLSDDTRPELAFSEGEWYTWDTTPIPQEAIGATVNFDKKDIAQLERRIEQINYSCADYGKKFLILDLLHCHFYRKSLVLIQDFYE